MATLVTGGTGFVGVNIVKELAARGHDVVSLDVMPQDSLTQQFLGELTSRVTFVTGDILDTAGLETLRTAHSIDRVVHAAVFTVNRTDLETARSKDILDINLTGTGNLLELARLAGVQRFIYVSSGAAYGLTRDPDQTYNEDDPRNPAICTASPNLPARASPGATVSCTGSTPSACGSARPTAPWSA